MYGSNTQTGSIHNGKKKECVSYLYILFISYNPAYVSSFSQICLRPPVDAFFNSWGAVIIFDQRIVLSVVYCNLYLFTFVHFSVYFVKYKFVLTFQLLRLLVEAPVFHLLGRCCCQVEILHVFRCFLFQFLSLFFCFFFKFF